MIMKTPSHPGLLVKHECLEPLGLTITAGATVLGVTRKTLSEIVNARAGISPEMAVRLAKAFGSTARVWLDMQTAYELSRIDPAQIDVKPYKATTQTA
jgi:addiction module HigA family antidote